MDKSDMFQFALGAMVFGGLILTYIGAAVVEGDGGLIGYIEMFAGMGIALAAIPADRLWRYFEERRRY